MGYLSFQPNIIQYKTKHSKENLQCDNWDGVKVNKQAISIKHDNLTIY